MSSFPISATARHLIIIGLLLKEGLVTHNGSAFLKELALRGDERFVALLDRFEAIDAQQFISDINSLIEAEGNALFQALYSDCSLEVAKTLSKAERESRSLTSEKALIYGEVDFLSFTRVLHRLHLPPGGVFYDLGSGTGRALFVARLTQDFSRCVGIEILSGLHTAAEAVCSRFHAHFRAFLSTSQQQHVEVVHGSFLDYDWQDGDVVFANSTCFDEDLMARIRERAALLKPGSLFITFTKDLNAPETFELLDRKRFRMSWGPATVYLQRRLGADGRPVSDVGLSLSGASSSAAAKPSANASAAAAAPAAAAAAALGSDMVQGNGSGNGGDTAGGNSTESDELQHPHSESVGFRAGRGDEYGASSGNGNGAGDKTGGGEGALEGVPMGGLRLAVDLSAPLDAPAAYDSPQGTALLRRKAQRPPIGHRFQHSEPQDEVDDEDADTEGGEQK